MEKKDESYELDLTWEQLEEQRQANKLKDNPPKQRIKKYI